MRHELCDLLPATEYKFSRNATQAEPVRSDAEGRVAIEGRISDTSPQTFELTS